MMIFAVVLLVSLHVHWSVCSSPQLITDCQLVIVGGSTAALGATLIASKLLNTSVCLLEPTDWPGGQLTSELLSAPDFAFHKVIDKDTNFTLDVGTLDRQVDNQNPLFKAMLDVLGDSGHCWVSPKCSIPSEFHSRVVSPLLDQIRVLTNTVIKRVTKDSTGRRIVQIDAVQRTANASTKNTCRFLSEELLDWYSEDDSPWFTKTSISLTNIAFVIEGTSWGEVLVLSNASYLQGVMEQFDGDTSGVGNDHCGQSFTFDFLEQLSSTPVDEPPNPLPEPTGGGNYSLKDQSWERVWTYRRVNTSTTGSERVAVHDITIQNWGAGNDFGREFFFLPVADAEEQRASNRWQGGVNLDAIRQAEEQAYGYHYWYRQQAPEQWKNRTVLLRSLSSSGTCHGLAKMPYLRESRRSIGIDNFLMNISTISGHARDLHGYIFDDRLCLGAYDVDIHPMYDCTYPSYVYQFYPILPYYIPLRAMSNRDIDNLFVIGKTMAQSFLVNSATRLHPVEFSAGQALGVTSAYAVLMQLQNVSQLLQEEHLRRVQSLVKEITPISWTINGQRYPND